MTSASSVVRLATSKGWLIPPAADLRFRMRWGILRRCRSFSTGYKRNLGQWLQTRCLPVGQPKLGKRRTQSVLQPWLHRHRAPFAPARSCGLQTRTQTLFSGDWLKSQPAGLLIIIQVQQRVHSHTPSSQDKAAAIVCVNRVFNCVRRHKRCLRTGDREVKE